MKVLAWYTTIFTALLIITFILFLVGVVEAPPFTTREAVAWAVLNVPVLVLGILVLRRSE